MLEIGTGRAILLRRWLTGVRRTALSRSDWPSYPTLLQRTGFAMLIHDRTILRARCTGVRRQLEHLRLHREFCKGWLIC